MTTTDLIQLFKDTLKGDLLSDQNQEFRSDAVIVDALNNAMNQMSIWCGFSKPDVLAIVSNAGGYVYTLESLSTTNRIRKINSMTNVATRDTFKVRPVSDLTNRYPQWLTDTLTGSPYGVWQNGNKIIIYPTNTVADSFYFDCECNAQELDATDPTREPELYLPIHNNIAYLAAAMVAERNVMTPVQAGIVKGIYQDAMSDCRDSLFDTAVQL